MKLLQALVLMIQNWLNGASYSFVHGSKNQYFVLCCLHYQLQETKQTSDTSVFWEGSYTRKEWRHSQKNRRVQELLKAPMKLQESKTIKLWNVPRHSEYHIFLIANLFLNISITYVNMTKKLLQFLHLFLHMAWQILLLRSHHHQYHYTGCPEFTSGAKLKGIRYINEQSKLLIECMSALVYVHLS